MYNSYGPDSVGNDCPSLEEKIAKLKKQIDVDKNFIKAMDDFAGLHGPHALDELEVLKAYGNLAYSIKQNEIELDKMISMQETPKSRRKKSKK